jgi:hypothetical protein
MVGQPQQLEANYSGPIPITANSQTKESCLKLLHGECDYKECIFLYL